MLTVKQLADKLEVSKQTINNNVPDDMSYQKINNVNYISEQLEIAITNNINKNKQRFNYDNNQSENVQSETISSNDNDSEMIKQLRSEIDRLSSQLDIKDKQLDKRDNQIEQITKALTNEQSLNLDNSNKIANLEKEIANKDKQIIELDNTTHNMSGNSVYTDVEDNSSSTFDVGSKHMDKDIGSNDTNYKGTDEVHNPDKDSSANEAPYKKKSLFSWLFNK